jgi:hypothetical protein
MGIVVQPLDYRATQHDYEQKGRKNKAPMALHQQKVEGVTRCFRVHTTASNDKASIGSRSLAMQSVFSKKATIRHPDFDPTKNAENMLV